MLKTPDNTGILFPYLVAKVRMGLTPGFCFLVVISLTAIRKYMAPGQCNMGVMKREGEQSKKVIFHAAASVLYAVFILVIERKQQFFKC